MLRDDEELALGTPKQRGVLAVLLITANRVVAVDRALARRAAASLDLVRTGR